MNLSLAFMLTFTACSGDFVVPVGDPIDGMTVACRSVDTDADGLPDCEEAQLGTSPRTDDTDGDGLTDFAEVVDRNFDPGSNNFRFNPRIADLPRLAFEITSLPDIRIAYTTTEGTSETIGVERTTESASTVTTSQTQESSHSIEETITTEASIGLELGFSVSGSLSESMSSSLSWTDSQTRENRSAYARSEATTRETGTELTGGSLRVTLAVENRGYQSVTLDRLIVAALHADPRMPGRFTPITNLEFESDDGFPAIEIAPNGTSSDQLVFAADLDLDVALSLLEDSRNLVLEPAVWSAHDIDGRSFNAPLETIGAKCARVLIDYGPGVGGQGRPAESYFVSAVTDFDARSIGVRAVLENVLRVPFSDNAGVLGAIRNVEASSTGRWIVALTTSDGVAYERTIFDPNDNAANIDTIELRPGSTLELVYIEDNDGDGLLAREEFLAGASDQNSDSDADGLNDYEEAKVGWEVPLILDVTERVFSSPATADLDIDGIDDAMERQLGTNPNSDDTDRDGLRDDLDPAPADVSPVTHLALDGNATAAKGTDFVNNGATPTADRHGRANGAMRFDGASVITGDAVYEQRDENGASWSMWIRPEGLQPDVRLGFLDHDIENTWCAMWVAPEGIGGSGSAYGRHFIGLADETGNVTSGWHHVVGVLADQTDEVRGADTFLIYYDGVLRAEIQNNAPPLAVEAGAWTIGGGVGRADLSAFIGSIDEVQFYERSLTPKEVGALFEGP